MCAAVARGGGGDCGQDLDPRICLRSDRRPFAAGRGPQPVGCALHHGRLQRRQRRCSCQRYGAAGAGHRHRRIDPDSGGIVRRGRLQAIVCQRTAGGRVPAVVEPRPRGPDRQLRRGCASAVRSDCRTRLRLAGQSSAVAGGLDYHGQLRPGRRRGGSPSISGGATVVWRYVAGDCRAGAAGGRNERHLAGSATRRGLRRPCRAHAGCATQV